MIPFNHLGFAFKKFGAVIYPGVVRDELCTFLKSVENNASVLDIGSGTGVMSELAYDCNQELRLVAVDPSKGMIKYSPEYLETHIATAEALPFEDDSFEAILMGEALHHFHEPQKAFEEVLRVLKKEGKLFIYEFDPSTFMGKFICMTEKMLGEPAHFYLSDDLKEILEEYGFSVKISQHNWRYTVSAYLK